MQYTAGGAAATRHDPRYHNLASDTTTLLALGKTIETLNLCQLASSAPRVGMGRGAGSVNAGGMGRGVGAVNLSCFWCVAKDHTLIDCTGPAPNHTAKLARDEMIAGRKSEQSGRNAERKARRLADDNSVAAFNAQVNDDEEEDAELTEDTYAVIQVLFFEIEPTKQ